MCSKQGSTHIWNIPSSRTFTALHASGDFDLRHSNAVEYIEPLLNSYCLFPGRQQVSTVHPHHWRQCAVGFFKNSVARKCRNHYSCDRFTPWASTVSCFQLHSQANPKAKVHLKKKRLDKKSQCTYTRIYTQNKYYLHVIRKYTARLYIYMCVCVCVCVSTLYPSISIHTCVCVWISCPCTPFTALTSYVLRNHLDWATIRRYRTFAEKNALTLVLRACRRACPGHEMKNSLVAGKLVAHICTYLHMLHTLWHGGLRDFSQLRSLDAHTVQRCNICTHRNRPAARLIRNPDNPRLACKPV